MLSGNYLFYRKCTLSPGRRSCPPFCFIPLSDRITLSYNLSSALAHFNMEIKIKNALDSEGSSRPISFLFTAPCCAAPLGANEQRVSNLGDQYVISGTDMHLL